MVAVRRYSCGDCDVGAIDPLGAVFCEQPASPSATPGRTTSVLMTRSLLPTTASVSQAHSASQIYDTVSGGTRVKNRELSHLAVTSDPYTARALNIERRKCVLHSYSVDSNGSVARWSLRHRSQEPADAYALARAAVLATQFPTRKTASHPHKNQPEARTGHRRSAPVRAFFSGDYTSLQRQRKLKSQTKTRAPRPGSGRSGNRSRVRNHPRRCNPHATFAGAAGHGARREKQRLLLLAGAGFLGGPEGNSSAHGLLLDRSRGTAELARNLAGRSSRLGELLQITQFTGAPGGAVVRRTLCHYHSPIAHEGAFCG